MTLHLLHISHADGVAYRLTSVWYAVKFCVRVRLSVKFCSNPVIYIFIKEIIIICFCQPILLTKEQRFIFFRAFKMSVPNSPGRDDSLYKTALENLTLSSFNESEYGKDDATDIDQTLEYNSDSDLKDSTLNLISSESSDSVEIDPKSKLANKTIFKSENPNLSIIEINNTTPKEDEEAVYLVESDNEDKSATYSNTKGLNYNSTGLATSLPVPSTSTFNEGSNSKSIRTKRVIKIYDTIEEFEKNLPKTVTILTTPFGSKVYLVGTAHFSEESQDDVSFVIRNVQPDIVMVELCQSRIHILKHDEKTLLEEAQNINLSKIKSIINTNGLVNGVFYLLLLHMSAQLAKELGMAPGGEFRRAFEEILNLKGCLLQLGDRPINITLQRGLRSLSLWQTIKFVWRLTSTGSTSVEEIEDCKQQDLLEKLMKEMAGEFPAFSDVFVTERDLYLCHSLQVAAMPQSLPDRPPRPVKVVGVIGIGHVSGIVKNWGHVDSSKIPEILKIPPYNISLVVFKYTVKYSIIALAAYGAFRFLKPKLRGIL